jgi:very-short-patch-repair endonuclease
LTETENLFNVAITRARSKLHVMGDLNGCLTCGIDYIERFAREYGSGSVVPADNRLPWTSAEDKVGYYERPLYEALVAHGLKPIAQYSEGPYKLDLALISGGLKLDVEVDGEYFHSTWSGEQARLDLRRDIRLIERGWKTKRFWAQEVRDDAERCAREVLSITETASR